MVAGTEAFRGHHANFYKTKRAARKRAALDKVERPHLNQDVVRCRRWDVESESWVHGWCRVLA